jgi:hypothetical protein
MPPNMPKVSYGTMNTATHHYGAKSKFDTVYDYYAGAHYINMTSDEFAAYLKNKYNTPFNVCALPFDEKLLIKYKLDSNRDKEFGPAGDNIIEHQQYLLSNHDTIKLYKAKWWDKYTYGRPSDIDWAKINWDDHRVKK